MGLAATEDTATTVTARPVSGATGAVTTVSSDELAASEARSGADFLREVPGLNLLASGGRAGVTNAWIRGSDPTSCSCSSTASRSTTRPS